MKQGIEKTARKYIENFAHGKFRTQREGQLSLMDNRKRPFRTRKGNFSLPENQIFGKKCLETFGTKTFLIFGMKNFEVFGTKTFEIFVTKTDFRHEIFRDFRYENFHDFRQEDVRDFRYCNKYWCK